MKKLAFVAGPGCGKTHKLLEEFEKYSKEGKLVSMISVTLSPIFEFARRKYGVEKRLDTVNTIYGSLLRGLIRSGARDKNIVNKFLNPSVNSVKKKKLS